jgi:hypothetical protein
MAYQGAIASQHITALVGVLNMIRIMRVLLSEVNKLTAYNKKRPPKEPLLVFNKRLALLASKYRKSRQGRTK